MDGELEPALTRACLEQACRNPRSRADWAIWHAAGDALRSCDVGCLHSDEFSERLSRALSAEPTLLAPNAFRGEHFVRRVLLPGGAIAAAAAMLVIVAVPQLRSNPEQQLASVQETKAEPAKATSKAAAPSPASTAPARVAAEELMSPQLEDYLAAHREMSPGSMMTRSVLYLRAAPASPEGAR